MKTYVTIPIDNTDMQLLIEDSKKDLRPIKHHILFVLNRGMVAIGLKSEESISKTYTHENKGERE